VVSNSLLGIYGEHSGGIEVIEEDDYGRRLFLYTGVSIASDKKVYSDWRYIVGFFVSQKTEDEKVYYYEDVNYTLYEQSTEASPLELITTEDMNRLKTKNDWNTPVVESKCITKEISRQNKGYSTGLIKSLKRGSVMDKVANALGVQAGYSLSDPYYLTSDEYDRHIYFFRAIQENGEGSSDDTYTDSYVVMFNADGSFDPDTGIMEITDPYDYQDALHDFKQRNGWHTAP
jgi:hypothetical protein